jgi:hypothetical protein
MNIIYETTKERGATILIPTSMVDSMNPVVAGSKPRRKRRADLCRCQPTRGKNAWRLRKQPVHKGFPKAPTADPTKESATRAAEPTQKLRHF